MDRAWERAFVGQKAVVVVTWWMRTMKLWSLMHRSNSICQVYASLGCRQPRRLRLWDILLWAALSMHEDCHNRQCLSDGTRVMALGSFPERTAFASL